MVDHEYLNALLGTVVLGSALLIFLAFAVATVVVVALSLLGVL